MQSRPLPRSPFFLIVSPFNIIKGGTGCTGTTWRLAGDPIKTFIIWHRRLCLHPGNRS